ncbi:hypothetical protein VP01_67g6, partial [Puccinia sorghi]
AQEPIASQIACYTRFKNCVGFSDRTLLPLEEELIIALQDYHSQKGTYGLRTVVTANIIGFDGRIWHQVRQLESMLHCKAQVPNTTSALCCIAMLHWHFSILNGELSILQNPVSHQYRSKDASKDSAIFSRCNSKD